MKALLLENIHTDAVDSLRSRGFEVETRKGALDPQELMAALDGVDLLGIRSKTHVTREVFEAHPTLKAVGAFCIGTNQVDLEYAAQHGIAVFNSPFANSRSVAELVIAEIITLARQLGDRSNEMHRGTWNKVSHKCWEIRGKTLGK